MHLTITVAGSDAVIALEVPGSMTVHDLRQLVKDEYGRSSDDPVELSVNGRVLSFDAATLDDCGIRDQDMVRLGPLETESQAAADEDPQVENARQQILYNPNLFVELSQRYPELAQAIHEPAAFRRMYHQMHSASSTKDDQQRAIDENLALAMEEMPEAFATVTMLYANIEVNGVPVKAFVDSGAQTTIMSPECAERCQLSHLIDKRHRGMAYGVGQATILGRIHLAPVKIGGSFFACAMTVIEGTNMDMLLGLDMLRHHQAVIDLKRNCLVMGSEQLPFLSESEIPKAPAPAPDFVTSSAPGSAGPKPPGTNPASSGLATGPATGTATGTTPAAPPPTTFKKDDTGTRAADAAEARHISNTRGKAPTQGTPLGTSTSSNRFPDDVVQNLMGLGFNRDQVVRALHTAGGNADFAAAILFDG